MGPGRGSRSELCRGAWVRARVPTLHTASDNRPLREFQRRGDPAQRGLQALIAALPKVCVCVCVAGQVEGGGGRRAMVNVPVGSLPRAGWALGVGCDLMR